MQMLLGWFKISSLGRKKKKRILRLCLKELVCVCWGAVWGTEFSPLSNRYICRVFSIFLIEILLQGRGLLMFTETL